MKFSVNDYHMCIYVCIYPFLENRLTFIARPRTRKIAN